MPQLWSLRPVIFCQRGTQSIREMGFFERSMREEEESFRKKLWNPAPEKLFSVKLRYPRLKQFKEASFERKKKFNSVKSRW